VAQAIPTQPKPATRPAPSAPNAQTEPEQYPALVIETAKRTGFRPDELIHSKFTNQRTGEVTEVVYPTFGARLRRFHEDHEEVQVEGGIYVKTTFIERANPAQFVVVEAEVKTKRGTFQDVGSASATRDTKLTRTLMEVAHTRAVGRALRLAGYGVEFDDEEGILINAQAIEPTPSPVHEGAAAAQVGGVRVQIDTAPRPVHRLTGEAKLLGQMTPDEQAAHLAPEHQTPLAAKLQAAATPKPGERDTGHIMTSQRCEANEGTCGKEVGVATAKTSYKKFGAVFCAVHQREAMEERPA